MRERLRAVLIRRNSSMIDRVKEQYDVSRLIALTYGDDSLSKPLAETAQQTCNVGDREEDVAKPPTGVQIRDMNECTLRSVASVSKITPTASTKPIENHHLAERTHPLCNALHEYGLTHATSAVDNEGSTVSSGQRRNLIGNGALNQILNRREGIRCRIEAIFMIDSQFGQYGDTINAIVATASRACLDAYKIAQLQESLFGFRVAGLAPRREDLTDSTIRLFKRSTPT